MKKLNLFLLLSALFALVAQPCFSKHPVFVSAGIQGSWIKGDASSWSNTPLIHAQFGAGTTILDLSDQISLRGEALLSMQGAKWSYTGEMAESGHTNIAYLNIPFVLRYLDKARFYGELGLQPGFLLGAKDHYPGGSENYTKYINGFDLGIPVGVGYEFKNNFGVGLRYIYGITNINKNSTDENEKNHNVVLALRVTYTFNKNRK